MFCYILIILIVIINIDHFVRLSILLLLKRLTFFFFYFPKTVSKTNDILLLTLTMETKVENNSIFYVLISYIHKNVYWLSTF